MANKVKKKRAAKKRRNPVRRRTFEEKQLSGLRRIEMGMRLRQLRELFDVEQLEIARSLGISASRWFNYEHGKRPVDLDVLHELCKKYSVTTDWLILGVGTPPDASPKTKNHKPK